jgi:ATP-dependent RNA helicase RhlE
MSKRLRSFGSFHGASTTNHYRAGGRRSSGRYTHHAAAHTIDVSRFVQKAKDIDQVQTVITHSFADFKLATPLNANIFNKGYDTPTPIQDAAIMPILEGRDVIGLANTGTGKTAAFLIPIIQKLFKDRNNKTLIIVPTRELAQQINDEFLSLSAGMHLHSTVLIGGANINRQIHDLRRDPDVVVGTPGRIKDLVQHKDMYLEDFSIVVLDEVDLMVDIGFIQDVKYFISLLPVDRQSLFFSATISPKINDILRSFVTDPITISIKKQDTSETIDQDVIKVAFNESKIDKLHDLLIQDNFEKVLIFGRTKHGVDRLHRDLTTRGFKVGAIHGNKKQNFRQRTLESFRNNEIQILLATDVASRGLDIPSVTHVINYDLPESYEDYIHRIGRTGRAGKTGVALTFID